MSLPDSSGTTGGPPPPNPVLTAYENFVQTTPLVSRYVMNTLGVTYLTSFFLDVSFAVSNIPYFSLNRLELYRILLSPLICSSIFTLALAYFSFVEHGKRLEFSMGSAHFFYLLASLACVINIAHIGFTYLFWGLTGDQSWVFVPASGIWTILFPMISIECVQAPPHSVRKLFMWAVPTLYYPLVLLGIFSVLGGVQLSSGLAVAVGYAYGYGHLDAIKISDAKAKELEETYLSNFARREGWVVAHAATGSAAWNDVVVGSSSAGFNLFTSPSGDRSNIAAAGATGGGTAASNSGASGESFPSGGGRQLGGPTRRTAGTTDAARAARLKALEGKNSKQEGDENV